MLGLGRKKTAWHWVAHGKHPAAGDYFTLGKEDSLIKAICNWLDQGYQQCCRQQCPVKMDYSWRFWLKTPHKNSLAIGILKNSCDRSKRAYPLLIMGGGRLDGWEKNLELLPLALEKSWTQMEFVSVQNFADIAELEREVLRIPLPDGNWSALAKFNHGYEMSSLPGKGLFSNNECLALEKKSELFVAMPVAKSEELRRHISALHMAMKSQLATQPTATFIGGDTTRAAMCIFTRSLILMDVKKLVCNE